MQEWIRTMVLYFSPPFLLDGGFCFDRFRLRFHKFSAKDSSSCFPVVMPFDFFVDSQSFQELGKDIDCGC